MATYLEDQAYCPNCDESVLVRARGVNHVLHLLLTILLCGGWWLPVWAILCITADPEWRCQRCGRQCNGPGNPNRKLGIILLCLVLAVPVIIILVWVLFVALLVGTTAVAPAVAPAPPTTAPQTAATDPSEASRTTESRGAVPTVPAVPKRSPEETAGASKPSFRPPLPTPKPGPPALVTIKPAKGSAVLLGTSQYAVGAASKSADEQERWMKMGEVIQLTAPTEVEVLSGDKNYSKVRLNGKEWVISTHWLTPDK